MKHFIEYYRHYLLGRKFVVHSDHQALKRLFSLNEPKNRVARWVEILSAYNFEIEYRPGKKHENTDAMSRCPNPRDCQCESANNSLSCGPCIKCKKMSMGMQSSIYVNLDLVKQDKKSQKELIRRTATKASCSACLMPHKLMRAIWFL